MKFENIKFDDGIKKEWVITNGIGGYASSTILGINTRKYHGLLVAPLTPPAQRHLILSKVDESIEIDGKRYDLTSNMCDGGYISDGYKYLESFEKEFIPIFSYKVNDVQLKKYIVMEHGKNTVTIYYRVFNTDNKTKLILTPLLNFRDFHQETPNHNFDIRQEEKQGKIRVVIDDNRSKPIYIRVSDANYIRQDNDCFRNMYYVEEEKRGFPAVEDHAIVGRYEVEVEPNELKEITFVASLEENIDEIDGKEMINKEITRISGLAYDSGLEEQFKTITDSVDTKKLFMDYIVATDNFVAFRPTFGLHTILAGYPWFLDWGRDALVSFEGLLLKTKRYQVAREVLLTMIRDIKYGLVPNRIFWI